MTVFPEPKQGSYTRILEIEMQLEHLWALDASVPTCFLFQVHQDIHKLERELQELLDG